MTTSTLRQALRSLARTPLPATAAMLCLGLGIGANSAIFSLSRTLLSRNLPGVSEPDRLVAIHRTARGACCSENSYPVFRDLHEQTSVFAGVEAHFPLLSLTLGGGGDPERIWGQLVTEDYFPVLGVKMRLGRAPAPDEASAVVLANTLWKRRFGRAADILGRQILLNRGVFTVAGVAPEGFRGPDLGLVADIWVPAAAAALVMPQRPSFDDRSAPWLMAYARLRDGVSLPQAQAALDVLARRLERDHPATDRQRGFLAEPARSCHPAFRGAVTKAAWISSAIVAMVLLIACANVANLLLARASGRRKEFAIRAALGAGRSRIAMGMLTESLLLGLGGGLLGLLLCAGILHLIPSLDLPLAAPIDLHVPMDLRVLGFSFALSLMAGLTFGILPALGSARTELVGALKDSPAQVRPGRRFQARELLVAGQVALSTLLLIVTALFLRSLSAAASAEPGFRTRQLLLLDVDPRTLPNPEASLERLRERLAALPGVAGASYADIAPLSVAARAVNLGLPGATEDSQRVRADSSMVGPGYFGVLGIPLLQGRDFAADEPAGAAIVNQTAARLLWPGQSAVGKRLLRNGAPLEVAGIVRDARSRTLEEGQRPCIYLPFRAYSGREATPFGLTLLLRTGGNAAAAAPAARLELRAAEPALAVSNLRTIEQQIRNGMILPRLGALVFGAAGITGILLTAIGLGGVVSCSVARRTKEFGIRYALGARRAEVVGMVLKQGAVLSGAGLAVGLSAAWATSRLLAGFLYGVGSTDPVAFAAAPLVVLGVALAASYIPAHHAAATDPMKALRNG